MPFLVRWPGTIKPGTVSDGMVLNVDFAPTLLAAAGVDRARRHAGPQLPAAAARARQPHDWRTSMYYRYYHYPRHHQRAAALRRPHRRATS